jgi:SAM-dependent methyltransferase
MRRKKRPSLDAELVQACKEVFQDIIIDPATRISRVDVKKISTDGFASNARTPRYIVRVRTNNASMLRGDVEVFKGSYKERVEGVLDFLAKRIDPKAEVHLEIIGPNPPTVESLVPIRTLIQSGRLRESSPIVATANTYHIPYALVRGRHLIAPNPAIAKVLSHLIVNGHQTIETVLDVFSGTGTAAKVVCHLGNPKKVVVVENDSLKVARMKKHIKDPRIQFLVADACELRLSEDFDLVTADPYYEDVPRFLKLQLSQIAKRAKIFLLVSGGVENVQWNRDIRRALRNIGLKTKEHVAFGQMILEAQE